MKEHISMTDMHDPLILLINKRIDTHFITKQFHIFDDSHKHKGHKAAEEGGRHFRIVMVSKAFFEMSRIERQRIILDLLKDQMPFPIHALSMQLMTPEEWAKKLDTKI